MSPFATLSQLYRGPVRIPLQVHPRISGNLYAGRHRRSWSSRPRPPGAAGWTLVELLVCIAVLGILVLLVTQVASTALRKAHRVVCVGNLRQWGLATHLYLTDHNDYLPPEGSPNGLSTRQAWYVNLPAMLGIPAYTTRPWRTNASAPLDRSAWICPGNTNRSNGTNLFHYCLNDHIDGTGTRDQPVQLAQLHQPSTLVFLFDNGRRAAVAQHNNVHPNAHARGAQFLFLDGRVEWRKAREFWDPTRQRGLTNQADLRWFP